MRGRNSVIFFPLFLADKEITIKDFPLPGLYWRYLPLLIFVLTEALFTLIFQSPAVPFFPNASLVSFGPGVLTGVGAAVGFCSLETESDILSTVSAILLPAHPVISNAVQVNSINIFFFISLHSFIL